MSVHLRQLGGNCNLYSTTVQSQGHHVKGQLTYCCLTLFFTYWCGAQRSVQTPVSCSLTSISTVTGYQNNIFWATAHVKSVIYQPAVQPLCQPLCSGVGDLTPQVVPLLVVHELQSSPQVLQQMQHPKATQER